MSERAVIRVRGLGKRYQLGNRFLTNTLRDRLTFSARHLLRSRKGNVHTSPRDEFWALRDLSFDVNEGEVVGIIGQNGAGKSTLLKIMSGITEPTEGEVRMRGRTGALLEVGTGFHPELSGRENVFMNGAILGMSQSDIRRQFNAIVDFAGVERFIDTPVKRYSSGMLVRLGFAVAAHLNPEILVIDEVLAVGDAEFQRKCLGKMEHVSQSGRTILFVSHNMAAVQALCSRLLLLQKGRCEADGPSEAVVKKYYSSNLSTPAYDIDLTYHTARVIKIEPVLRRLQITDSNSVVMRSLVVGQAAKFRIGLKLQRRLVGVSIALHFHSSLGQRVMTLHSGYQGEALRLEGDASVECLCPVVQLTPGLYHLAVAIAADGRQIDRIEHAASVEVLPADFYSTGRMPPPRDGIFWPQAHWYRTDETIARHNQPSN